MRLSPLDIRKQDFDTSLRGYSKEDVDAFLHMVSEQWEEVLDEQRRLEDQVRTLENKMQHYEQVEEALQEALQTARENSEQKLENAQQKAALMVQEAEARADDIKREAREDREVMRRQVDQLQERRDKAVARLRAFLLSEMELLLRFEGKDPGELRDALPEDLAQHLAGEGTHATDESASAPGAAGTGRVRSEAGKTGETTSLQGKSSREEPPEKKPSEKKWSEKKIQETPSEFEMPVSEGLSGERAASQAASSEATSDKSQERQRTEATAPAPEETPGSPEADTLDEMDDFLEQFDAEVPPDESAEEPSPSEPAPNPASSSRAPAPSQGDAAAEEQPSQQAGQTQQSELDAIFASAEGRREAPSGGGTSGDGDDMTATSDEIEKIRRILNDME